MNTPATTQAPIVQKGKQRDQALIRTALPNAREIHAVRFTHVEQRTDKHGRTHNVTITDPWPRSYSLNAVLTRVLEAGLR